MAKIKKKGLGGCDATFMRHFIEIISKETKSAF